MRSSLRSSPQAEPRHRQSRRRSSHTSFSRSRFRVNSLEILEHRTLLSADLAVTETSNIGAATQGELIDYTISVQNIGDATANSSTLTDVLPAGLTLVSAWTDTGSVSMSGGTITGSLGNMNVGVTATLHVLASPDAGTTGVIANSVSVSSPADSNATNDTASADITVSAAPASAVDLSVTKSASTATAIPGQLVTYTVTVTNNSTTNSAANVHLGDMIPPEAVLVDGTSSQGTLSANYGALDASLGTLAPGASAAVVVRLIPAAAGTLNNTTVATTDSGDSDTSNNSGSASVTVNAAGAAAADLSLTKTDSPDPVVVGQYLTYSLTVSNDSTTNVAADTVVSDFLPPGVTFVSATSSQGTVSQIGNVITGSLGSLAAGTSATLTITVLPDVAGTIFNTASASTSSGDSNVANNSATATTTVNAAGAGAADLAVSKTDSPDPVTAGQNLTYTITVANNSGANAAADSTLIDTLPVGVTYVSATSSQGSVSQTSGVVTASLGTLAPGASATVIITVTPNSAGTITNTASATTSSGDTDLSNNTSTVTTTIASGGGGAGAGCYMSGQAGDGTDATFINNLYRELLGRDPDPVGQAFWTSFLDSSGNANQLNNLWRLQAIKFFRASQEYREHLVNCMYEHFLNRGAEAGGLQFFANQLAYGVSEEVVLSEIVGSQEYYLRNGNANQGFVDALYRDLLGRDPDLGGEVYWTNRAGMAGLTRDQIVREMLKTIEANHDVLNDPSGSALAQVTGGGWENLFFQGNLGGARDAFFDQLQANTPWDDVIENMLYADRYYDSSKSI